ncbi:MAG: hypothetical protein H6737_04440 [Alphaproteobacteria bacterium]|nr:hypothetical protein [Alphaproteobacteria bacterium]
MWWSVSALASTWNVPGDFSTIQAAFEAANVVDGDVIQLAAQDYPNAQIDFWDGKSLVLRGAGIGSTRLLGEGSVVVYVENGSLRIEDLTIDGEGLFLPVEVYGPATVELVGIGIVDGVDYDLESAGITIDLGGDVLIEGSSIVGCATDDDGGAIDVNPGTSVTIRNSIFLANSAANEGGAIQVDTNATAWIEDTLFEGNAADQGGAILSTGDLTLQNVTFRGNTASDGGALHVVGDSLVIDGSTFEDNVATVVGGAITGAVDADIQRTSFVGNSAGGDAGAIGVWDGSWTLSNVFACGNSSQSSGAFGFWVSSTYDLKNVLLTANGGSNAMWTEGVGDVANLTVYDEGSGIYAFLHGGSVVDSVVVGAGSSPPIAFVLNQPTTVGTTLFWQVTPGVPLGGWILDPSIQVDATSCATRFGLHPTANVFDRTGVGAVDPDGSPGDIGHLGGPGLDVAFWGADDDGDGVLTTLDCDDADPDVRPGAPELCDGVDDDCDGLVDDVDPDVVATVYYPDLDGDGYGDDLAAGTPFCAPPASGWADAQGDCDDGAASVYPGGVEACVDGVDNDCDGLVDAADPDFTAQGVEFWLDQDGDSVGTSADVYIGCSASAPVGYVSPSLGEDCDDGNPLVSPLETEICDQLDNDCDTQIDEGLGASPFYPDVDGDGYGDSASTPTLSCAALPGTVVSGGDCDDGDASINPAATEVCDGVDQNCVGGVDDGLPTTTYYNDADGDGFGDADDPGTPSCAVLSGHVLSATDCDDTDEDVNPDAVEVPDDGIDNDCDGEGAVTPVVDSDGDGVPDSVDPAPGSDGDVASPGLPEFRHGCGCTASISPRWMGLGALLRRR